MTNKEFHQNTIKSQEQQGEEYALFLVSEQKKIEKGEIFVTQWAWREQVLNFLREKILEFIGSTLKRLVIEKSVELSSWLLEKMEDKIIDLYNNASPEDKELFKNKLRESFPDSELLKKLENF